MSTVRAQALFDRALEEMGEHKYERAVEDLKEALSDSPHFPEALYNLACCFAVLNKTEEALVNLDRATKQDVSCIDWAKEDVEFDPLRNDPGFKKILEINDPVRKPSLNKEGLTDEQIEELRAKYGKPNSLSETSLYPPCPKCNGVLQKRELSLLSGLAVLAISLVGVIIALAFFTTVFGHLSGAILIAASFYLHSKKFEAFVCEKCKAVISEKKLQEIQIKSNSQTKSGQYQEMNSSHPYPVDSVAQPAGYEKTAGDPLGYGEDLAQLETDPDYADEPHGSVNDNMANAGKAKSAH